MQQPYTDPTSRVRSIANGLNERQRTYLVMAYREDQRREAIRRTPGDPGANVWRWIEYGPVGAKWLANGLLRRELEQAGLVDQGTGSTWSVLVERGLVRAKYQHTGFVDARSKRPIVSMMVRLETAGRKVARVLLSEPLVKPHPNVQPLSLTALRLIAYGQAHPGEIFDWTAVAGVEIKLAVSRSAPAAPERSRVIADRVIEVFRLGRRRGCLGLPQAVARRVPTPPAGTTAQQLFELGLLRSDQHHAAGRVLPSD
jgi:hypothetical protein